MLALPCDIIALMTVFAPLFSPSVLEHAQVLLTGAILTPGQRTVTTVLRAITTVLRAMGLSHQRPLRPFQNYHRVLNRAAWSPRQAAAILLRLLLRSFLPQGPVVVGCDDTIERRRGAKIAARGIYRDPVRSGAIRCDPVRSGAIRCDPVRSGAIQPFSFRQDQRPTLPAAYAGSASCC